MLHKQQRIRQVVDWVLKKARIQQPRIILTLRSYQTAQLLAAQGLGVTLVPTEYANFSQTSFNPAFLSIPAKYEAGWSMCIRSYTEGISSV